MDESTCYHPSSHFLYPATNGDGDEIAVMRCDECGAKHTESLY